MRASDIQIGKWYKNKEDDYGFYKVLEILKPKENENTSNRIMVKCLHSPWGNDSIGRIRYLKPSNIVEIK